MRKVTSQSLESWQLNDPWSVLIDNYGMEIEVSGRHLNVSFVRDTRWKQLN